MSAALQLKLQAASARITVTLQSDVLVQSKAAAKRGASTMLRPRLETGSAATRATADDRSSSSSIYSSALLKKYSPSPVFHTLWHTDGHGFSKPLRR